MGKKTYRSIWIFLPGGAISDRLYIEAAENRKITGPFIYGSRQGGGAGRTEIHDRRKQITAV